MAERREFQTEVSQLLDIVIHSLYSNKEIFLRELISNASDAIDKAKYEGLTNPAIYDGGTDWKIKLSFNAEAQTITIADNGIGMNHDEIVKSLGTIAHSGTKEFIKQLAEQGKESANLIGQFGVGFYSAFMVADHVSVVSRKRGEAADKAVRWESDAKSSYSIENTTKDTVGTEITMHVRDEDKNLLNDWTLKRIVGTYSDYIEYPIAMDVEKPIIGEDGKETDQTEVAEETLNSQKALWLKDKAEVTDEERNQFYRHITHDFADPAKVVQFKVEGTSEFSALLFIPSHAPFDLFHKDTSFGPMLYVKRVQIMEHCEELLPQYLRFVVGVVESSDLPLNISREILQNNRQIPLMQKNITRKVLEAISKMQQEEPEQYKKFYAELGKVLKEGIYYDHERKEAIAKLALFESTATKAGEYTTFDEYISRMKGEQNDIYYITGGTRRELENSPYLEGLKAKEIEVLFMTDEVDDIVFSQLNKYADKSLKSVLKGDLDVEKVAESTAKSYEELIKGIKESLGERVADVRLTARLKGSPVCLVTSEGAPDANMERLLKAMGQPVPTAKRTLELNPDHALLKAMQNANKDKVAEYAAILYDQAVLLEGGKLDNAAAFVNKMAELMADRI
ncbi:MAG: molecular chaperone HtpG [Deferribacteraceae bacterium]|jgi:molecular chaperone HtpG|nr:molecular chaperone HtpG [Deferribacteraceae bacterium]